MENGVLCGEVGRPEVVLEWLIPHLSFNDDIDYWGHVWNLQLIFNIVVSLPIGIYNARGKVEGVPPDHSLRVV